MYPISQTTYPTHKMHLHTILESVDGDNIHLIGGDLELLQYQFPM